jgi:alkanesulfonate monooxygenase SsuD/methylene tetrahydromethanopterin reductase-like flavin-dependent oxidoreductase (luciferase family)
MPRISWMLRYEPEYSKEDLVELTKELDDVGYHSVLLTVHSRSQDYLPKVASLLGTPGKVKYMLAVRPYLLSPQYFMMLWSALQSMEKDRVIINWVHGTLGPKENFDAVLNVPENMHKPMIRKKHMRDFLEALDKANMFKPVDMPDSLLSGGSEDTLKMVKEFNMHLGTGYDIFLNEHERYRAMDFSRTYVQVSIVVRDTDEEAEEVRSKKVLENKNLIVGSKETVLKKIQELESMGATDLLVSNAFSGGKEERDIIHRFIKETGITQ